SPGHAGWLTAQHPAVHLNYTRASRRTTAGALSAQTDGAVRATVARRTSPWTEPELRSRK
ncbi:MAG: hypothetical protein VYC95_07250, partial [Verrucomicrobiota bacterium]|nr:hypothetical protein [Verrucomicrobiota bacterium]